MGIGLKFGFGSGKEKAIAKSEARLRDAIARKVCVTASYDRGPIHLFEPYALLQSADGGDARLLAIRMDGPAGPSNHEDLENLEVAKLGLLEITSQEFTPDPRFDARDSKFAGTVVAAV
jgi:hypothetical protein